MVRDAGSSDETDHVAQTQGTVKDAWSRTLHDMQAMAEDRESEGFETATLPAGDTTPKPPSAGETDEWGLVHVVPDNTVESFRDCYEGCEFDETGVYQVMDGGHVFLVTENIDMDSGVVVYVAGSYRMQFAGELVRTATGRDEMYTHVKTLDGTKLGTFEHDDPSAFFPDPETFYSYEA